MNDKYEYYKSKINSSPKFSVEDKLEYIRYVESLEIKNLPVIFNKYHLSNIAGIKYTILNRLIENPENNYTVFYISKKSGGYRKIEAPSVNLLFIQNYIKEEILSKVMVHDNCYGFIPNKSIIENATVHLNQEMILNVDLKNFFPTIKSNRIFYIFRKLCGYNEAVSTILTKIVTYKGRLPQGAPTSPMISNIISYKLDIRLDGYAKSCGIKYTRYADDITFSGSELIINNHFFQLISKIILECGFYINYKKVRYCSCRSKQEVTGLILVQNEVHVPKKYIKKIRQELYYINKYGLNNHLLKSNVKNSFYKEHLLGKILYVNYIQPRHGKRLLEEFNNIDWSKVIL